MIRPPDKSAYLKIIFSLLNQNMLWLGPIAQLVATSSFPAQYHTLVEIDHETNFFFGLFKKGCCQLQVKVCAQSTG